MADVVIIGTGALARSITYSLATVMLDRGQVIVVGRSVVSMEEVSTIAGVRARLIGSKMRFASRVIDLESQAAIESIMLELEPTVVVCCASYHSPWEGITRPSAWTKLVKQAGFGVTLALQTVIARRVAYALALRSPQTIFINACFPDAVNPVLHSLGLNVFCGVGNVAVLAAALQTTLCLDSSHPLQVLAHHVHLYPPQARRAEARAWVDGKPVVDVEQGLEAVRKAARRETVHIAGCSAALLIRAIISGEDLRVSLPGPSGLPGGYPVRLQGRALSLDLPEALTADAAIEWNQRVGEGDGVSVRPGGDIVFSPPAQEALRPHLAKVADGFRSGDIDDVCRKMLILRDKLRRRS